MRLYFFTLYNLSGIQKGIQAGHAALEYVEQHFDHPEYREFIENHKTWILLSGGGSEDMKERMHELASFKIPYTTFTEPDLNNSISAICFLMDEKDFMRPREFAIGECLEINRWINSFQLAPN